jgi:hypothetical protein
MERVEFPDGDMAENQGERPGIYIILTLLIQASVAVGVMDRKNWTT